MSEKEKSDHDEMLKLIRENAVLVRENNELLKKIYRQTIWGMIFKGVWIAIIIGLPFAIYFYILEPYFEVLGANYEVFREGFGEIPGLKGFTHIFPGYVSE
ncbi:MAG TPA: hypothetical protein VFV22_03110 [Candidatus Paceibacterota bacterium]|nr:hypothetical protein [Candidatus Paceibacterota bacterium]